jgi:hypothetical protein
MAVMSHLKIGLQHRRRQTGGIVVLMMLLLAASAAPTYAWHGHHWHRHHWHRRSSVVIVPRVVVPFGPFWPSYTYPSVVVAPPPVYVPPPPVYSNPPPPPQYWYYCDQLQAYYPYVQQCPGGWRQVLPTLPQ